MQINTPVHLKVPVSASAQPAAEGGGECEQLWFIHLCKNKFTLHNFFFFLTSRWFLSFASTRGRAELRRLASRL